jgi:hypothetical protein
MDGIGMEVWVPGCGVYAVILANPEFQKVGEGELAKEKRIKGPGIAPGFLVHAHTSLCTASFMREGHKAGSHVVDKHQHDRV